MRLPSFFPRSARLLTGLALLSVTLSACYSEPDHPAQPQSYTLSGKVLIAAPSAFKPQSLTNANWQAPHVAGQVIVLGGGRITAQSLGEQRISAQSIAGTTLLLARTPAGQSDQAFAQQLAAKGFTVQPNYLYQPLSLPNDPGYPGNAGISVSGVQKHQDYLSRINALSGWEAIQAQGKPLSGALSAFLDSGVAYTHPDLQGRLLNGADCSQAVIANNTTLATTPCVTSAQAAIETSSNGHGTATAGFMGAVGNNGIGLTGLTWTGKNLLPVSVFDVISGNATTVALAAGINYAMSQGVKVINMSLGFAGGLDKTDVEDQALAQMISKAAGADILMIAAAGNKPKVGLYYPANDPNVMAVGAVGNTDDLACYSARPFANQKAVDIVAPGGNAGTGTDFCEQNSPDDLLSLNPSGYALNAGTSEAAPIVSGAAALLRGLRPDLSATQIKNILTSSAKTVAAGKLLDVGAAVQATLKAAPNTGGGVVVPPAHPSERLLKVVAQNARTTRSYSKVVDVTTLPASLPYRIADLPAGEYTVNASLIDNVSTRQGQSVVTITGDTTQDIAIP